MTALRCDNVTNDEKKDVPYRNILLCLDPYVKGHSQKSDYGVILGYDGVCVKHCTICSGSEATSDAARCYDSPSCIRSDPKKRITRRKESDHIDALALDKDVEGNIFVGY